MSSRIVLAFDAISEIETIGVSTDLPQNMAVAAGDTWSSRFNDAVNTLRTEPHINIVVLLPHDHRPDDRELKSMFQIENSKKLRIRYGRESLQSLSFSTTHVANVLKQRMSSKPTKNCFEQCDVDAFSKAIASSMMNFVDSVGTFPVISASSHYNAVYTVNGVMAHVDEQSQKSKLWGDTRIVKTEEGRGTILFGDETFCLEQSRSETGGIITDKFHSLVNQHKGFMVPTGGVVVLRSSVPEMDLNKYKPAIHAHGVGDDVLIKDNRIDHLDKNNISQRYVRRMDLNCCLYS